MHLEMIQGLQKVYEGVTVTCKRRLMKKFDVLQERENNNTCSRWVLKYSSRQLSDNEEKVLRRELNFAPTPKTIPIPTMDASTEDGSKKVKSSKVPIARINIAGAFKKAKLPQFNIRKMYDYKCLSNLQKDDSILILPADRGDLQFYWIGRSMRVKLSPRYLIVILTKNCRVIRIRMNSLLFKSQEHCRRFIIYYSRIRSSAGKTPQFYGLSIKETRPT